MLKLTLQTLVKYYSFINCFFWLQSFISTELLLFITQTVYIFSGGPTVTVTSQPVPQPYPVHGGPPHSGYAGVGQNYPPAMPMPQPQPGNYSLIIHVIFSAFSVSNSLVIY